MVGDTNHDLIVKGKVWEVKLVSKKGGPFRTAKKGKITKFKFSRNLLKIVNYLDDVVDRLPNLGEDFNEISPELLDSLRKWNERIATVHTPKTAILAGEMSDSFKEFMIGLINTIKKEIEVNTDDEFTYVKFGGVNVGSKEKGIDPVNVQKVGDDSITLNFIGRDVLEVLEELNDMPYVDNGDFVGDINDAVVQITNDFPPMIIFSYSGQIAILPKEELKNKLEFDGISQNEIRLKIKDEFFQK